MTFSTLVNCPCPEYTVLVGPEIKPGSRDLKALGQCFGEIGINKKAVRVIRLDREPLKKTKGVVASLHEEFHRLYTDNGGIPVVCVGSLSWFIATLKKSALSNVMYRRHDVLISADKKVEATAKAVTAYCIRDTEALVDYLVPKEEYISDLKCLTTEPNLSGLEREWVTDLLFLKGKDISKIVIDTETTGLDYNKDSVFPFMVQLTYDGKKAYCLPVHEEFYPELERDQKKLNRQLKGFLEKGEFIISGHNLKFDLHQLCKLDIKIVDPSRLEDTALLAWHINENLTSFSLNNCARVYCNKFYNFNMLEEDVLDKEDMINMPPDLLLQYGSNDVLATWELSEVLNYEIKKLPGCKHVYDYYDIPAYWVFTYYIEQGGFSVDESVRKESYEAIEKEIAETAASLHRSIPEAIKEKYPEGISLSSPKFLADIMYSTSGFGLEVNKTTPKGAPSVSSKARKYVQDNAWITLLNHYSKLLKARDAYLKPDCAFSKYIVDGWVRGTYQFGRTDTGRLACLDGNAKVRVLDERGEASIKNIKKGDWIWSHDGINVVPAKVTKAFKSGTAKELVKINYKIKNTKRNIVCTPEHKIFLLGGQTVHAAGLKKGDKVESLSVKVRSGYRYLYDCKSSRYGVAEHRYVWQATHKGSLGNKQVHHKDHVRANNVPSNLQALSAEAHVALHAKESKSEKKSNYRKTRRLNTTGCPHNGKGFVVEAVEVLKVKRDVYDLTVEGTNCFYANSILVHNSSNPNAQNISKRGPIAKYIRKGFKAPKGYVYLEADYSSVEVRLMAWIAKSKAMMDAYVADRDLHTLTTASIYSIKYEELAFRIKKEDKEAEEMRQKGKSANLSLQYLTSVYGFKNYCAEVMSIFLSDEEAQLIYDTYYNTYPELRLFFNSTENEARKFGYIETLLGSRRRVPSIESNKKGIQNRAVRIAVNTKVQGTAAFFAKRAVYETAEALIKDDMLVTSRAKLCGKIVFTGMVHDSLLFLVPEEKVEYLSQLLHKTMIDCFFREPHVCPIPIKIDIKTMETLAG
jgi:DNA polymerase I-like protein with 3'-5' exonuclease and polymerase domains